MKYTFLVIVFSCELIFGSMVESRNAQGKKDRQLLFEDCAKNGHPEAVQKIKDSFDSVNTCVEMKMKMPKTSKTEDYYYNYYCKPIWAMRECREEFEFHIKSCLDTKESANFEAFSNAYKKVVEYACNQEEKRYSMFFNEGGKMCLEQQKETIKICSNVTFINRMLNTDVNNPETFSFTQQDCNDIEIMGQCIVKEMKKCENKKPAYMVDDLFKFIRKNSSCNYGHEGDLGESSLNNNSDKGIIMLLQKKLKALNNELDLCKKLSKQSEEKNAVGTNVPIAPINQLGTTEANIAKVSKVIQKKNVNNHH